MKTVEVFKTNVRSRLAAVQLVNRLQLLFPASRINFDLDDCDRILRLEGPGICCEQVMKTLNADGYDCLILV